MDLKSKIILIYGPTAAGKTKFAVKLAKKIKGEIINADSMQVYKNFKVLTARPSKEDTKNVKHYLFGFKDAKKDFSVGDWIAQVKKRIELIKKKNKIPILVGGTGLYFKAITEGLVKITNIPSKTRAKIRNLHIKIGQNNFFNELIRIDPLVNNKIKPNDVQRSLRAYEVKFFTKKSIFNWYKETKPIFKKSEFVKIYVDFPRSELIERINFRTKKMLENGSIMEVKKFLRLRVSKDSTASKAIGILEIKDFLNNRLSLKQVIEKISIKTRQYAKRQSTWARGQMIGWNKIYPNSLNKILKKF